VLDAGWEVAEGRVRGTSGGARFSLSLRRAWLLEPVMAAPPKSSVAAGWFMLRGGSRIEGRPVGGDAKVVHFRLASNHVVKVPWAHLAGFRLRARPSNPAVEQGFEGLLVTPPVDQDQLFVLDAKKRLRRFPCRVEGFEGEFVRAVLAGESRLVSFARLHAIVFAETSGLAAQPAPGLVWSEVQLHDGRLLRGTLETVDRRVVTLRMFEKFSMRVPLRSVRTIEIRSKGLLYLSTIQSVKESRVPSLGRSWPVLRDRGLGDQPLSIGKRVYRRGFLVVPQVALEFTLPRAYALLVGEVGMPRARIGSATLRVVVDGKLVGEPIALVANGKPIPLSVPIAGAKRIAVEVLCTDDLDAGGRVVLGDLRVVVD
jgi:hypothetical protein